MSSHPLAAKDSTMLVEFRYGDPRQPAFRRYTDSEVSVYFAGSEFEATPTMEITLNKRTGVLREDPAKIQLPHNPFSLQISGIEPHSPVYGIVWEILSAHDGSQRDSLVHQSGRAYLATRNPSGKPGTVIVEVHSWKKHIDGRAGIPATEDCGNTFGGNGCFVSLGPLERVGSLSFINDTTVTINGLPTRAAGYWSRGSLKLDGLNIRIRSWDVATPSLFKLDRVVPAGWLNQLVTVVPGCDKLPGTCEFTWGNLEHFNGRGIAMPDYNPTLEAPAV